MNGPMSLLIRLAMSDLMPRGEGEDGLPGIADTGVSEFLVQLRRESDRSYWLGLVLGALVYIGSPVLTLGIPLPSFALTPRLRELHASRVERLPSYLLRQAVFVLRLSAGMCWGRDAVVRARLGLLPLPEDPGSFRR